jgi:hypothetical protein
MQAAIGVLADADGTAQAHYLATMAENATKETFAKLFLSYSGSIDERKSRATINPEFMEVKRRKPCAILSGARPR